MTIYHFYSRRFVFSEPFPSDQYHLKTFEISRFAWLGRHDDFSANLHTYHTYTVWAVSSKYMTQAMYTASAAVDDPSLKLSTDSRAQFANLDDLDVRRGFITLLANTTFCAQNTDWFNPVHTHKENLSRMSTVCNFNSGRNTGAFWRNDRSRKFVLVFRPAWNFHHYINTTTFKRRKRSYTKTSRDISKLTCKVIIISCFRPYKWQSETTLPKVLKFARVFMTVDFLETNLESIY